MKMKAVGGKHRPIVSVKGSRKGVPAARKKGVKARGGGTRVNQAPTGYKGLSVRSAGAAAGRAAGQPLYAGEKELKIRASQAWSRWWGSRKRSGSWREYAVLSRIFMQAFAKASGRRVGYTVPLPTEKSVSVVINAPGAQPSILRVLDQLRRLPLHEIIVILSGQSEGVWQPVGAHPSLPTIIRYPEVLGSDAGRAVGAKFTSSDIVLFLDEESPVRAEQLLPFIRSIASGTDLALNDTASRLGAFGSRGPDAMVSEFLNCAQQRRDLGTASLRAYPHALSRQAIERLTPSRLAVPSAAQAEALALGLKASAPASVRTGGAGLTGLPAAQTDELARQIILGDYMEAIQNQIRLAGDRSGYPDGIRRREKVKEAAAACV
jgi:hypothetical protein